MTLTRYAAAAVLLAGLTAIPAAAQKVEERVDRTIAFAPGGTLRLKTFSGKVEIRGTQGQEVVIHAVRRAEPDKLRDIHFTIEQQGTTLVVDANENAGDRRNDNVVEADIEIQVPMHTRLDVKSFSAPVRVHDVDGPAEFDSFSGNVLIETRSWTDGQALEVKTFSGDIDLRLPDTARGELAFNTFSGDLTSDLPLTISGTRGRRSVQATLNGGGTGRVQLKTFSGDATLRR